MKFAYVVPGFRQSDRRDALTLERSRNVLLRSRDELDAPVLEDTAYRALRFEGEASALAFRRSTSPRVGSLDASRVVYLGTFSKTVAPGLRVGWVCASRALIRRFVLVKQASDLQRLRHQSDGRCIDLAETRHDALDRGGDREHYRRQARRACSAALAAHMPKSRALDQAARRPVRLGRPCPRACRGAELLERAVREVKVAFVPGGAFLPRRQRREHDPAVVLAAGAGGDHRRRSTAGVAVLSANVRTPDPLLPDAGCSRAQFAQRGLARQSH